jgi:hypothetical protein
VTGLKRLNDALCLLVGSICALVLVFAPGELLIELNNHGVSYWPHAVTHLLKTVVVAGLIGALAWRCTSWAPAGRTREGRTRRRARA